MHWRQSLLFWTAASTLLTLLWAATLGWALWSVLEPPQRASLEGLLRPHAAIVVLLVGLLPLLLAALWQAWLRAYPRVAARMRDEVLLIGNANPSHRIVPAGAPEMRHLGAAINALADSHQALGLDVDARIGEANARLAQERSRLAALMAELTHGVLVCNREGRILLYNARASALLAAGETGDAAAGGAPVGLNRSVFGILAKGPIVHALQQLARRLEQRVPRPVAHFVTTRRHAGRDGEAGQASVQAGQLLRVQMVPLREAPSGDGALTGFVLILDDITREVEADSRRESLLQQLTEGTRASLASLRAAAETLQEHPAMAPAMRGRFVAAIREEAERLSRQLDEALARGGDAPRSPWPREDILAADLVFALQRSLEAGLDLPSRFDGDPSPLWLQLDSHAMVQALAHLVGALRAALELNDLQLELSASGRFARLDLCWQGRALEAERLHDVERQVFSLGEAGRPVTLGQVLAQHGAELWSQPDRATGRQRLCLQLPTIQPEPGGSESAAPSRPVYYDFDLFHQAGQSTALDNLPLAELSYTVFDSETTGLAPADGDEIISLGAVRIVNGRMLEHETFDRLIKPRRAVSAESQRIHGITTRMLADQPPLEQVLPMFARFAEDTVLIAHNAAFDMRFLELARQRTGLHFDQPVLDTLLLSSLVHPGHRDRDHQLERIAARLGLAVVGRHTALGDAIVTGEVFLKLLPLLAECGIHTLGQAREASQRSMYAALEY